MKIKHLDELKENQTGIIIKISLDDKLLNHLFHLGFFKGTSITFKQTTPFNNPLIFYLKEYKIALSKEIAKNILIEI